MGVENFENNTNGLRKNRKHHVQNFMQRITGGWYPLIRSERAPRQISDNEMFIRLSETEKDCRVSARLCPRDFGPGADKKFLITNGTSWIFFR